MSYDLNYILRQQTCQWLLCFLFLLTEQAVKKCNKKLEKRNRQKCKISS